MQALLHAGERTSRHEMVDTDFAMAMAAATPGPLGGGCWALRHCVDEDASELGHPRDEGHVAAAAGQAGFEVT